MIEFENVRFTYDGETFVIDGVNLRIRRGEFVCILGGNGSGKSTIAKLADALLTPDEGRVRVMGEDTSDPAVTYLVRSSAGLVFQNPDDQIVSSVIENDVAFGPENLGVEQENLREVVTRSLAAVGLAGCEKRETATLSGGQKQRVAIAGVLAMKPDVIILDESTAMLDPSGRREVMNTVHRLNREEGISVVIITHYMSEAATADYMIVMDDGRIAMNGTPREVFTKVDKVRALGLDVPPMTDLAHSLRADGVDVRADVLTVDEMVEEVCRLSSNI